MNKNTTVLDMVLRNAPIPLSLVLLLASPAARAQLNVAAVNTAYTINFDGTVGGVESGAWAGGGFQPVPINGRLNSDAWEITGWTDGDLLYGGTRITAGTDYRRGTTAPGNAAVAVPGMYSFGGAGITGRALGFQSGAAGDWTPGTITLRVQNNTGSTLTAFDVAYNVYYRNDQNSSSNFNLYYSDDNTTFTHVSSQDVTSPAASSGTAWVANARSTTVSGVYVPNGQYFYVRWRGNDVTVSGARDEFSLDDISVTGRAYTLVRLTASTASVSESVGTTTVTASIVNPHLVNPTTVDLALTSGPAARINNYTTQTMTFPGGSVVNQNVTITVSDNGACDGDAAEVFTLQNIGGGITPSIGTPSTQTMTIVDDETAPASYAQAFDGGVGDNWSITAGAGQVSSTTGAADTPANQRVLSAADSWQVKNTTVSLDLATVDVTDWFTTTLTARLSSTAQSAIEGADGSDDVKFFVNLNGSGFPVAPDIKISGNSNARWGYSTGTGVASTTAGTPVTFQPASGGNRTTDGYSHISITIPNGTTSVALRVTAKNNNGNELWNLDDVKISGTLCTPIYYTRANGSETSATWSTSRTGLPAPGAVTFNKNKSMVVQNGHTVNTTANPTIDVRNYTVESGGVMTITNIGTMNLHGPVFKVDGTLNSNDDNFDLKSTTTTTISGAAGTIDVFDLTQDDGGALVTINTVKVRGTLQLNKGNFDANNKEVQLISTATSTARLGAVPAIASYSSKLRLERYIPAGVTDWRLLCSPIQGKTVSDWTDDFYTAGFPGSYYPNFIVNGNPWPSVRKYDETNPGLLDSDGLIGVSSVSDALSIGKGFAAWSGTTLNTTTAFNIDVRGLPQIASTPFTIPMSYTNSPATAAIDGLNLVGNPLPSPIDFGSLSLGADVDNQYYIYDPGSGVNVGWDENTLLGTGGCNGNIQSSQGFWLHCTGPANTVTVLESAKVLEPFNGGVFSDQIDTRLKIRMLLSGAGNAYTDEALVHFISGDPSFSTPDMIKLSFGNDNAMRISTKATTGEDLMINAYGPLTSAVDIPVKVRVPVSGEYTITFNDLGPISGVACMSLQDLLTNTTTPVIEGGTYTFSIDTAAAVEPTRFVLHVGTPVSMVKNDATCAGLSDGSITVNGPGAGPWDYSLVYPDSSVVVNIGMIGARTYNGLVAGNYHLYVEGNTGCGGLVQTVRVDAPAAMTATATTTPTSCVDATNGTADPTPMGGTAPYSFAWGDGSTDEDLAQAQAGDHHVTITDAHGCTFTVEHVNIVAGTGPVAQFTTSSTNLQTTDTLFVFNTGTYGLTYSWDFGDGTSSTENEPIHQYANGGTYSVTLTTTDGVCSATASMDVQVAFSTGINDNANRAMSAWCENSQFIVQWQVQDAKGMTAEVIDATGRSVIDRSAKGSMGRITIPAMELPSGIYFLRMRANGTERTFKLPLAR